MMADTHSGSIPDTRYSQRQDGADDGPSNVTETTPFLAVHRRLQESGDSRASAELHAAPPALRPGSCQPDSASQQFRISCLSYYDPYHDAQYAAHYLIPLKPLLTRYDGVQDRSIPGVVPGAVDVSRSLERAGGASRNERNRPSSALVLGGHFDVYAEISPERTTQIRNTLPRSNRDDLLAQASRQSEPGDLWLAQKSRNPEPTNQWPTQTSRDQEPTYQWPTSSSTYPTTDLSSGGMLSRDPLVAVIQRSLTPNWKVDYVDFTPELSGFETGNICCKESFPDLIKKVNHWLRQNPQIEAKTCEMITWSTPEVSRVGDSESMIQEQHTPFMTLDDTYHVMGLRVWIVPRTSIGLSQVVNYRDFQLEDGDSLTELLQQANNYLDKEMLQGNVLCFETVMLPSFRSHDTSSLFWREKENTHRTFDVFLRLFFVEGPKTAYRLGIRNIVPELVQGNYEPFSCLMRRASQWVSSEPSVNVTNLRSTYLSRDNDSPGQAADRCRQYFRDFTKEQYFQIIRIYHVSSPSVPASKHVINCMTFTPVQSSLGPSTEATFETMKSTMLRIDAWIRLSGAKIFSLESLITPLVPTQPNHTLPEMTHWVPKLTTSRDNGRKKFLLHIRIYIDGEFIDPDPRLLPPLPYSLTKQLESSLEEKELKRFIKKKKMRKTQNRIAIAMFMFILVSVALGIIIGRMLGRYYR